jgi:hypothetical protein
MSPKLKATSAKSSYTIPSALRYRLIVSYSNQGYQDFVINEIWKHGRQLNANG